MNRSFNSSSHLYFVFIFAFMVLALSFCGSGENEGGLLGNKLSNIPESDFPTVLTGTSYNDFAEKIAADSKNNVIVTGVTYGSLEDDEASEGNALLFKYSPKGEILWQKEFSRGYGRDICVDKSDDSIYVIFSSLYSFEGISHEGRTGFPDVFLFKFNSSGEKLWSAQIATDNDDSGAAIDVDSSGNLYLAGHTRGDLAGTGVFGDYDFYIRKFTKEGNVLKTIQFGTDTTDIATGIGFDSSNNVYITGRTLGAYASPAAGMYDLALAKFDPDLNEIWKVQKGTAKNDKPNGLAIDSNDNIFLAGTTYAALGEGGTSVGYDVFLAKYNSAGNEIFIKQLDTDGTEETLDIAIDSNDKIYVAGVLTEVFEGNESAGEQDAFMMRYDTEGNIDLIVQFGTPMNDEVRGIAIDSHDDVLMTGVSFADFDGLKNKGGSDIFILKYDNP